jgi:uncharacterized protein YndB with AHSA1/START domain
MSEVTATAIADRDRVLEITRIFEASPAQVYAAWTEPDKWECEIDLKPGGAWRTVLRHKDGDEHICLGRFKEVEPPHRLVMTMQWDYGDQLGHQTIVTVELRDLGAGQTEMRFHQALFTEQRYRDLHQGGWSASFDGLEQFLERGADSEN